MLFALCSQSQGTPSAHPRMISASSHIERRWEPGAKWYLLTLVIHDQDDDISGPVDAYERYISSKGLSDIPFHMVESMHGRRSYEGVGLADRKRLLMSFNAQAPQDGDQQAQEDVQVEGMDWQSAIKERDCRIAELEVQVTAIDEAQHKITCKGIVELARLRGLIKTTLDVAPGSTGSGYVKTGGNALAKGTLLLNVTSGNLMRVTADVTRPSTSTGIMNISVEGVGNVYGGGSTLTATSPLDITNDVTSIDLSGYAALEGRRSPARSRASPRRQTPTSPPRSTWTTP